MLVASLILGAHIATIHAPQRPHQENVNPGIYFHTADGLTGGVYRNTLGRTSAYLGLTAESGPFSITLGAVTGYQSKRRSVSCAEAGYAPEKTGCWWDTGYSRGAVTVFAAPSVRIPLTESWAGRVTYMPAVGRRNGSSAFHFSLERSFP